MREFQDRRKAKKFLHSRYAIAFLIIIIALVARGVWGIYVKYEKSSALAEKSRADLAVLQAREAVLSKSIATLNTDEGREKEIRDRFGVVKPGEKLVILVDGAPAAKASANAINDSWWRKFLDSIGL
ncbi:MAG TPA: septum formation initiator family protein [Candidatus Paceibacterota bacterium]